MKKLLFSIIVILIALTLLPVSADDRADVAAAGELRLGIAPEYIPFVFYDESGTLTGIDIALMEEVGRRMGLQLRTINIAFDSLIDALSIGQIDVIGGAFSKTDERQQEIDFTRIYYKGDAQFIGRTSLSIPEVVDFDSFREMKIGVQKGTSFDQWVKTNLVGAGYVSLTGVYVYQTAAAEMQALDRGDVDLVLLDQDIYEAVYRSSGKYKVFYEGFAKENYAFGLRKGSNLTAEISRHLTDMLTDGTAQTIANRFFSRNYGEAEITITRPEQLLTPMPSISQAPVPTPTASAGTSVDYMTFGADMTITDGHQVQPGERFTKTWRVKNTGTTTWTPQYSFVFVSGDQMNGQSIRIPTNVAPGQLVDLSVDLTAPSAAGTYRGYWQMRSPYGQNFGETIWVKIRVAGNGNGSGSAPQFVSGPGSRSNPLEILSFYPEYYAGRKGDCLKVSWNIRGSGFLQIKVDGTIQARSGNMQSSETICGSIEKTGQHEVQLYVYNESTDAVSSFYYQTGS